MAGVHRVRDGPQRELVIAKVDGHDDCEHAAKRCGKHRHLPPADEGATKLRERNGSEDQTERQ